MTGADRMPPLDPAMMTQAQKQAADELAAGPRGGVKGPFIPLLRSPEKDETVRSLAEGRRPAGMAKDEEIAYELYDELSRTRGVSEATYRRAVQELGEQGVIDMLGLVGYFTTVSMVMNVAHTPAPKDGSVSALRSFPL